MWGKKTWILQTLPEAQQTQKLTLWLGLNLLTLWHHFHQLQIWPPDGATCISCKFDHQMAPLALVANLATRWRHLHWLQIWPPDGATCISWLHQLFALLPMLATRLHHCIATLPYWHYQLVLSWYPHQPESHQLSLTKRLVVCDGHPDPKIGTQVYLGLIKRPPLIEDMLNWKDALAEDLE